MESEDEIDRILLTDLWIVVFAKCMSTFTAFAGQDPREHTTKRDRTFGLRSIRDGRWLIVIDVGGRDASLREGGRDATPGRGRLGVFSSSIILTDRQSRDEILEFVEILVELIVLSIEGRGVSFGLVAVDRDR